MEFNGINLITYMSQRLDRDVRIEDLCRITNLNRFELTNHFKEQFGLTPIKFFWYFKTVVTFRIAIKFTDEKIHKIADFMNYRNREHFSKKTQELLGLKLTELSSSSGTQKINHKMNTFALVENCMFTLIKKIESIIERAIENFQLRYQESKFHQNTSTITHIN